jgi:hypothetical protein
VPIAGPMIGLAGAVIADLAIRPAQAAIFVVAHRLFDRPASHRAATV